LASGNLTCWGSNTLGQLGFGTTDVLPNVALGLVALAEPVRQVAAGGAQTCAVLSSGALNCWGNGRVGALGYGSNASRFEPGEDNVPVGASVSSASSGAGSTCAVTAGGFVRCWGRNPRGLLGYGHPDSVGITETPEAAATLLATTGVPLGGDVPLGGGGVVQVEVNSDSGHTCVRFAGGTVRCWGSNDGGSLGYGHELDIGDDETPADAARIGPDQIGGDVPFGRSVLALASGGRCAVLNDRSIVCWGRNTQGQIGIPSLVPGGSISQTPADLVAAGLDPIVIE
jgi:alpha-tubulin suppressor-like RCC1 family protein